MSRSIGRLIQSALRPELYSHTYIYATPFQSFFEPFAVGWLIASRILAVVPPKNYESWLNVCINREFRVKRKLASESKLKRELDEIKRQRVS